MDTLYPICPDCLFIGEGTGATSLAANWGETTHMYCGTHCVTWSLMVITDSSWRTQQRLDSLFSEGLTWDFPLQHFVGCHVQSTCQ